MAKRIEIDGKFYRRRRGKLVLIPEEWVGKDTYKQTIRKRKSTKLWKRLATFLQPGRRVRYKGKEDAHKKEMQNGES